MSYQLEDGIPLPARIRVGRKLSPETKIMREMEVGQSFLVTEHDRWVFVRSKLTPLRPKRYSIHQVQGGWRVWRIE